MFISGLECGSKLHSSNDSLKRKLLVYFFLGNNNSIMYIMIVSKMKLHVRGSHGSLSQVEIVSFEPVTVVT